MDYPDYSSFIESRGTVSDEAVRRAVLTASKEILRDLRTQSGMSRSIIITSPPRRIYIDNYSQALIPLLVLVG